MSDWKTGMCPSCGAETECKAVNTLECCLPYTEPAHSLGKRVKELEAEVERLQAELKKTQSFVSREWW